jgi:hypothetical protein
MQESITLKTTESLSAVAHQEDGRTLAVTEFLHQHQSALQSMVEVYWFSKKGSVVDLAIDDASIRFQTAANGIFVVKYKVSYFFACDDITTDNWENMVCSFHIDLDNQTVMIAGENQPERTPDEF